MTRKFALHNTAVEEGSGRKDGGRKRKGRSRCDAGGRKVGEMSSGSLGTELFISASTQDPHESCGNSTRSGGRDRRQSKSGPRDGLEGAGDGLGEGLLARLVEVDVPLGFNEAFICASEKWD